MWCFWHLDKGAHFWLMEARALWLSRWLVPVQSRRRYCFPQGWSRSPEGVNLPASIWGDGPMARWVRVSLEETWPLGLCASPALPPTQCLSCQEYVSFPALSLSCLWASKIGIVIPDFFCYKIAWIVRCSVKCHEIEKKVLPVKLGTPSFVR